MTSSLFEPNSPLLAKFQTLDGVTRIVNVSTVETRRLDDIPETAGADFLKMDVQGGELLVLKGAEARLKDVLVVHTEVEFVPLYKDQPFFADIDGFLRARGFAFHKINALAGRTFKPLIPNNNAERRPEPESLGRRGLCPRLHGVRRLGPRGAVEDRNHLSRELQVLRSRGRGPGRL